MKCVIIAGGTGTGKTTIVKGLLKKHRELCKSHKKKCKQLVYDVNNEYGHPYVKMEDFLDKVRRENDAFIVFEEATIFFPTGGVPNEMREILVRKRHTNNFLVFNFHSLSQVPLAILMFCDKFYVKKTNDQLSQIERKYKGNERIYEAFREVHNSPNKYATKVIKFQ